MKRRLRTPAARAKTLHDFNVPEILKFLSGFDPADARDRSRCRWRSRNQFVRDFLSVRDALAVMFRGGLRADLGPMFGDCAAEYRECHGPEALEQAISADIRAVIHVTDGVVITMMLDPDVVRFLLAGPSLSMGPRARQLFEGELSAVAACWRAHEDALRREATRLGIAPRFFGGRFYGEAAASTPLRPGLPPPRGRGRRC
jgi:hypothetical protein